MNLSSLEAALQYRFRDRSLLENALIHSSYANENKGKTAGSNERLEFLGDSVLGVLAAEHLYRTHPDLPEGELTRIRAGLVCEQSLVQGARYLNLGAYLKLGRGEEIGGGRQRPSILADTVEAILAAVYLDGGLEAARRVLFPLFLEEDKEKSIVQDYKTALQELVQREAGRVLSYQLLWEQGPDHDKRFAVEVCLNGSPIGTGEGRSKKEAEQAAARAAMEQDA